MSCAYCDADLFSAADKHAVDCLVRVRHERDAALGRAKAAEADAERLRAVLRDASAWFGGGEQTDEYRDQIRRRMKDAIGDKP